jgi:hypothetical protein
MTPHKFKTGQTVTLIPNRSYATPSGRFEIVRPMPAEHGRYQYRLRSIADGHERVAQESELQ